MYSGICNTVDTFNRVVINPLLLLMFAFGTLYFIFGVVEFLWGLSQDTDHKNTGKQHMLWGLIGLFVMISAWSILKLIAYSVGASLSCNA
jgi:hypothetical protein